MTLWNEESTTTEKIARRYTIDLKSPLEEVTNTYHIKSFSGYNRLVIETEEIREITKTNNRVREDDLSSTTSEEDS